MVISYRRRFTRRRYGGPRKRWYFRAGANLPFIGKTNIAFGNKKRGLNNRIKRVVRAQLEEPKMKIWANPQVTVQAGHIYCINLLGNIGQGDGTRFDREGDSIFLDSFKGRFYLNNADLITTTSNNIEYRIMIVKHDYDTKAASDTWGDNSVGSTDLFKASEAGTMTDQNSITQGLFDPTKVTKVYDRIVTIQPKISGYIVNRTCEVNLNIKQKFTYKAGTNYGKFNNWYLLIGANSYGATTNTNLGNVYFTGQLYFKDK